MNWIGRMNLLGMVIACMALACPVLTLEANNVLEVGRGDTVRLEAPSGGINYQWYYSTDASAFGALRNASSQQLTVAAYAQTYYYCSVRTSSGWQSTGDTTLVKVKGSQYLKNLSVMSAGQSYTEQNGTRGFGVGRVRDESENGAFKLVGYLHSWTNSKAHIMTFVHHPVSMVDASLVMRAKVGKTIRFHLSVTDPADHSVVYGESDVCFKSTGESQEIPMISLPRLTKSKYYRYDLECLQGCTDIDTIRYWNFKTTASSAKSYCAFNRSAPAPFLDNWHSTASDVPQGQMGDWMYVEVMIPEESHTSNYYAMTMGWPAGYSGLQINGINGENFDINFSVWDGINRDNMPVIPEYYRAYALATHDNPEGGYVSFTGEGSGNQTFLSGQHWQIGEWVQMLAHSRLDTVPYVAKAQDGTDSVFTQVNSLISLWWNPGGRGWQFVACQAIPRSTYRFSGWSSFVEDYSGDNGQLQRLCYFRNGYIHSFKTNKWYHCNAINSSDKTDTSTEYGGRGDKGSGVAPGHSDWFMLQAGEYTPFYLGAQEVELRTDNTPVDTIDTKSFENYIQYLVDADLAKRIKNNPIVGVKKIEALGGDIQAVYSPESHELLVPVATKAHKYIVSVYGISGDVFLSKRFNNPQVGENISLNVPSMVPGVYVVCVKAGNKAYRSKVYVY